MNPESTEQFDSDPLAPAFARFNNRPENQKIAVRALIKFLDTYGAFLPPEGLSVSHADWIVSFEKPEQGR